MSSNFSQSESNDVKWLFFYYVDEPLGKALEKAGLTSFLQHAQYAGVSLGDLNNVTVFAPSNEAFETIPEEIRRNPEVGSY